MLQYYFAPLKKAAKHNKTKTKKTDKKLKRKKTHTSNLGKATLTTKGILNEKQCDVCTVRFLLPILEFFVLISHHKSQIDVRTKFGGSNTSWKTWKYCIDLETTGKVKIVGKVLVLEFCASCSKMEKLIALP